MADKMQLTFNSVYQLLQKVEILKAAHRQVCDERKIVLSKNKIPFVEVNDLGVAIDLNLLTNEQRAIVAGYDNSYLDGIYELLGITKLNV